MNLARRISSPRRGLSQEEAALYVGVSLSKFRDLVERDLMPKPKLIDSARVWDMATLDIYFGALPEDTRSASQRAPVSGDPRPAGFDWK